MLQVMIYFCFILLSRDNDGAVYYTKPHLLWNFSAINFKTYPWFFTELFWWIQFFSLKRLKIDGFLNEKSKNFLSGNAKMLKRNWNWRNNRLFCHIFVLVKFQLGGRAPWALPLGYAYENKKGIRKFSTRFLAFSNKISTVQKIVLSSTRGQSNFRGLEASRSRPRTWPLRPRPRTSKCVLEDVLEA